MSNVPLLRKVHEQILTDPEHHDQGVWGYFNECGSVFCAAGWAGVLAGYEPVFCDGALVGFIDPASGVELLPRDAGEQALGLSRNESWFLFVDCQPREAVLAELEELIAKGEAESRGS